MPGSLARYGEKSGWWTARYANIPLTTGRTNVRAMQEKRKTGIKFVNIAEVHWYE